MAKRFKMRICRVIATTLQSCRSKDPSNLPQDPVPSFPPLSKFSTLHFSFPKHQPHSPAVNHHLSPAFVSVGPTGPQTFQFKWQKEEKWHVVSKTHQPRLKTHNSYDLTFAPPPPPPSVNKNRTGAKKKKKISSRLRFSTSSADSGWFSSDGASAEIDEEETETLVSSPRSSSESNLQPIQETQPLPHSHSHRRNKNRRVSKLRTKRGCPRPTTAVPTAVEGETPARLSMFKKFIPCTVDGKVKESFAIVKRSEDPYEDFKNSMMDMILEKQMYEQEDLEQLLQCFLSLNSRNYHGIIVQAFSEIWEAIFYPAGFKPSDHHHR